MATQERSLPFTCERLFDLAADLEAYPQFMPGWLSARILHRAQDRCQAEQVVGVGPMRVRFESVALLQRPERIEMRSEQEPFRRFFLYWHFQSLPGEAARVQLGAELELRSRLLQRFVEEGSTRAIGEAMEAFERRAYERLGSSAARPGPAAPLE